MNTTALLIELGKQGVELRAEGAHIRYRAPRSTLTPELRAAMGEHKAELLALLADLSSPISTDGGKDRQVRDQSRQGQRQISVRPWRPAELSGGKFAPGNSS